MKKKIVRDISANSIQVVINQLSGILIFYFCSKFLDKTAFGELNWSIALLVTSFNILGFGMDQLTVRKVAAGQDIPSLLRLYVWHVLLAGIGFYLLLLGGCFSFPAFFHAHGLLIALGVSQLLLFFTMPFKQVANGQEEFRILLFMSTCSNIIKVAAITALALVNQLTIERVLLIYIIGSTIELLVCVYFSKTLLLHAARVPFNRKKYKAFIQESLPQLGSIIFNAAVARFDWILLGIISTSVILAEYSFAYRVFEVSTLPLQILGPLLLPKFTRLFHNTGEPDLLGGKGELLLLLQAEIAMACFIALVLNMLWVPVIDMITAGKYGQVNINNILVLSGCMPLLYVTNFLWTINFAKGRLKLLFIIIVITFGVNALGDFILIPFMKGLGAAIAFFVAIVVQAIFYLLRTRLGHISRIWQSLLLNGGSALTSGWVGSHFFTNPAYRTGIAVILYFFLITCTGQLKLAKWRTFKSILGI